MEWSCLEAVATGGLAGGCAACGAEALRRGARCAVRGACCVMCVATMAAADSSTSSRPSYRRARRAVAVAASLSAR